MYELSVMVDLPRQIWIIFLCSLEDDLVPSDRLRQQAKRLLPWNS